MISNKDLQLPAYIVAFGSDCLVFIFAPLQSLACPCLRKCAIISQTLSCKVCMHYAVCHDQKNKSVEILVTQALNDSVRCHSSYYSPIQTLKEANELILAYIKTSTCVLSTCIPLSVSNVINLFPKISSSASYTLHFLSTSNCQQIL